LCYNRVESEGMSHMHTILSVWRKDLIGWALRQPIENVQTKDNFSVIKSSFVDVHDITLTELSDPFPNWTIDSKLIGLSDEYATSLIPFLLTYTKIVYLFIYENLHVCVDSLKM